MFSFAKCASANLSSLSCLKIKMTITEQFYEGLCLYRRVIHIDVNVFSLQLSYQLGNYKKILKVQVMKYLNNNIFRLLLDIKGVLKQVVML